jgi:membrane-associated protease RseP (regulator of RpoE activity)
MLEILIHYIVPFIAIVDAIIFAHLIGHFLACRLLSVKVGSISLGVGPRIASIKAGETSIQIRCIPIGGVIRPQFDDYSDKSCAKNVCIALSGPTFNILIALLVILVVFIIVGVPTVQDNNIQILQQSMSDAFLASMRMLFLTWTTWNTHTLGVVISPYNNGVLRFAFLAAIWSSQFGVLNFLPFPKFDGWTAIKFILIRFFGPSRADRLLLWLRRGIIVLVILVLAMATYNDLVHLHVIEYLRKLFS